MGIQECREGKEHERGVEKGEGLVERVPHRDWVVDLQWGHRYRAMNHMNVQRYKKDQIELVTANEMGG